MTNRILSLEPTESEMGYYDYDYDEIKIFLPIHKSRHEDLMIKEIITTIKHEDLHSEIFKATRKPSNNFEENLVSKISRAYRKKSEVKIFV